MKMRAKRGREINILVISNEWTSIAFASLASQPRTRFVLTFSVRQTHVSVPFLLFLFKNLSIIVQLPAEESNSRGNSLNILIFNSSADDHAARPGVHYSRATSQTMKPCAAMRFSLLDRNHYFSHSLVLFDTENAFFLHRYHYKRNSCLVLSSVITIRYDFQRNG